MKNLRLFLSICVMMVSLFAWSYDFEVDGIYYEITSVESKTVQVTYKEKSKASYTGEVTIPSSVTGNGITYRVTAIGEKAFYECRNLQNVTLPEGIITIGKEAFLGCWEVNDIIIPNSVTSIGYGAMSECHKIHKVNISKNVTKIGNKVFSYCPFIESIVIEEGNPVYDSRNNCNAIIETSTNTLINGCINTVIPNDVVELGTVCFAGAQLESLVIPENITKIGSYAFYYCENLKSLTIPATVTNIDSRAFGQCTNLTDVYVSWATPFAASDIFTGTPIDKATLHVPAGTKALYEAADVWKNFGSIEAPMPTDFVADGISYKVTDASKLTVEVTKGSKSYTGDIVIPATVTYEGYTFNVTAIGERAFYECSNLQKVTLPEGIITIGQEAFSGCYDLVDINIPSTVTTIQGHGFEYCYNITKLVIPSGTTSIGYCAFAGCSALKSIEVQEGNPVYDSRNNCNALIETSTNSIKTGCINTVIPNDVVRIDACAFDAVGIENLVVPDNITYLGMGAFYWCTTLKSIYIPSSVNVIETQCFEHTTSLTDVYVPWSTPLKILKSVFLDSSASKATLHVPVGTKALYEAAEGWKDFGTIVEEDVTGIADVSVPSDDVPAFNLNGTLTRSPRGIVIKNGKKVFFKN